MDKARSYINNIFPERVNQLSFGLSQREENGGLGQSQTVEEDITIKRFGSYELVYGNATGTTGTSAVTQCCTSSLSIAPSGALECSGTVVLTAVGDGGSCADALYSWAVSPADAGSVNPQTGKQVTLVANGCGDDCKSPITVTLSCDQQKTSIVFILPKCPTYANIQYTTLTMTPGSQQTLSVLEGDQQCGQVTYKWTINQGGDDPALVGTLVPNDVNGGRSAVYTAPGGGVNCTTPIQISLSCMDGDVEHPRDSISIAITPCPAGISIGYTTKSMQVGDKQTLVVYESLAIDCNADFTWALSGGGSLVPMQGKSVLYTAPPNNINCKDNAHITLMCNGIVKDSIEIAINSISAPDVAYWIVSAEDVGACSARIYKVPYNCSGVAGGKQGCFSCQGHLLECWQCTAGYDNCLPGPGGNCPECHLG